MNFIKEIRLTRIENRTTTHYYPTVTETTEEYKVGTIGVIRNPNYGSFLTWFIEAAFITKTDFPHLTDSDIKVVHYGGSYYKGTFGIEFCLPDMYEVPESYREIHELELTK